MSVIGGRYEFDVFFSYAWATNIGDPNLRNWSRKVADTIKSLLSQRFNGDGVAFRSFLDRDQTRSAQDIDEELQNATQRSGIFVAMVSDYYNSEYCLKEVNWFCNKIAAEGRTLADHVCILRIQQVSEGKWPIPLSAANKRPLLYIDFCDEHGRPRNMTEFVVGGALTDLAEPIDKATLEIADKIVGLKRQLQARKDYEDSQSLPNRGLLFLEAEALDRDRWNECGRLLSSVPNIVLPPGEPKPATDIASDDEYGDCDGLLMLRRRAGDDFSRRIRRAYLQRRKIFFERERSLPWALLDDLDDPPPEIELYDMPRIPLRGEWWSTLKKTWSSA